MLETFTAPYGIRKGIIMSSHRFQKLVDFIGMELANGSFPGAGLMVDRNGDRLFEHYWGTYCSHGQRANPLDARVSHMLYSFSKGISATVIMIAHQKKLVDYDAPVHAYIPEYRGGWKDVTTIRHLLTHSAGIPRCPLSAVYTHDEWGKGVAACCAAPVEWEPGSKTEYHAASGLFLAAEAVRRTMKMASWEEICREFLFTPLNAESLTFQIPSDPHVALTPQPKDLPCLIDTARFKLLGHPGGGCFGRLEDMIKVLELHLNQGVWKGRVLIRKEEVAEMHRIQYETLIANAVKSGSPRIHEPWGLGWLIRRDLKDHWFGFGQSTCPQTFSHAGIDTVLGIGEPERQIAIAFATTHSPNSPETTIRLRNTVTDLVVEAL
ncbi:MAG: serine hydrolase domain-containing protein [Victivallales bacterium]